MPETGKDAIVTVLSLRDLFETRLDGMDKSLILLQQVLEGRMDGLYARFEERFIRIDQVISERDKRTDQGIANSNTAFFAALQTQKETAFELQKASATAVAKAEFSTNESIKQLQTLFQTSIAGLSTQILDVKSRLDKGEGSGLGQRVAMEDSRSEKQEGSAKIFSVLAIAISVFIGIGQIWTTIKKDDHEDMLTTSVQKLQNDQYNLAKTAARQPVEKSDVDAMQQRLDALSGRLNSIQGNSIQPAPNK